MKRTPMPSRRELSCALIALSLAAPALADVHIVDPNGSGAGFPTIQSAIDAASSGDTVIVRSPLVATERYSGFTIDGKSLTVRGEGRPFLLTGAARIQNLSNGQMVVLQGLDLNRRTLPSTVLPAIDTSGPGLSVTATVGAVRLVNCSMEGSVGTRIWAGLQAQAALDLCLVDCLVLGTVSAAADTNGGGGLQSVASRLSIFHSEIVGGKGHTGLGTFEAFGSQGGSGLSLLQRSVAWIASSTVHGGEGGDATCGFYPCSDTPGDGGTGVQIGGGSICFESQSTFEGGAGGSTGFNSFNQDGNPGQAAIGSYTSNGTTHVIMNLDQATTRSGGTARVTLFGNPGEGARVAIARGGGFRFFGPTRGPMLVSEFVDPAGFIDLGPIPNNGSITVDLPLPVAAGSDQSETFVLQAALDSTGSAADFRLSVPRVVSVDGSAVASNFDRSVYRIDPNAAPGGDGSSWQAAVQTVEEAVARSPWTPAGANLDFWLRGGTHIIRQEDGILLGDSVRVIGGFDGTETSAGQADPAANATVIDGDVLGNGSLGAAAGDNSRTIFRVGSRDLGIDASGVELCGLEFIHSRDAFSQQGVVTVHGDAIINQCLFRENYMTPVFHTKGDLSIRRSRFLGNQGAIGGGIVSTSNVFNGALGSLGVESCVIAGNRSTSTSFSSLGNVGGLNVSAMSSVRVVGTTIYGNTTTNRCGGMGLRGVLSVWISNCIFQQNSLHSSPQPITSQFYMSGFSSLVLQYNSLPDLSFLYNVNGNIVGDPLLIDPLGPDGVAGTLDDDLRLGAGSPCIDAGNSLYLQPWSVLDVAGEPRRRDDPGVIDTGVGGAPVVDIGAHER